MYLRFGTGWRFDLQNVAAGKGAGVGDAVAVEDDAGGGFYDNSVTRAGIGGGASVTGRPAGEGRVGGNGVVSDGCPANAAHRDGGVAGTDDSIAADGDVVGELVVAIVAFAHGESGAFGSAKFEEAGVFDGVVEDAGGMDVGAFAPEGGMAHECDGRECGAGDVIAFDERARALEADAPGDAGAEVVVADNGAGLARDSQMTMASGVRVMG